MSLEFLFLLAVFVLLPLIQQLLEAARRRAERPQDPTASLPPGTPRVPASAPRPEALAMPPGPDMTSDATPAATSPAPPMTSTVPAKQAATPATPARRPRQPARRRHVGVGLGDRFDLRRAILLAAMLGPCRAVNPYDDGPEQARLPR